MTEGSQKLVRLHLVSSDGKYELRHMDANDQFLASFWTPRNRDLNAAWWFSQNSVSSWRMRVPEEHKKPGIMSGVLLTFSNPSALAQALVDNCSPVFAMQCLASLDIYCASNKIALKLPPVGPTYNDEWNHLYKQWHGQSNGEISLPPGGMCNIANVVHDEVTVPPDEAKKLNHESFRRAAKHISFVGLGADRLTIADEIYVRGMWPSGFEPKHYIPGVVDYIGLIKKRPADSQARCACCGCTDGQHRMNCPERTIGYEVSRGAIKAKDMPCLSCDAHVEKVDDGDVITHETSCPRHIRNWRKQKRQWTTVKPGMLKYSLDKSLALAEKQCCCPGHAHARSCAMNYREMSFISGLTAGAIAPVSAIMANKKIVGIGVSAPGAKPLPEIRSPAPPQDNDNIDLEDLLCSDVE